MIRTYQDNAEPSLVFFLLWCLRGSVAVRSGAQAMFYSRPIPECFLPSLRKGAVLVTGHQS
jgi:hypothetical protein